MPALDPLPSFSINLPFKSSFDQNNSDLIATLTQEKLVDATTNNSYVKFTFDPNEANTGFTHHDAVETKDSRFTRLDIAFLLALTITPISIKIVSDPRVVCYSVQDN